jgi:hypothetical protein
MVAQVDGGIAGWSRHHRHGGFGHRVRWCTARIRRLEGCAERGVPRTEHDSVSELLVADRAEPSHIGYFRCRLDPNCHRRARALHRHRLPERLGRRHVLQRTVLHGRQFGIIPRPKWSAVSVELGVGQHGQRRVSREREWILLDLRRFADCQPSRNSLFEANVRQVIP